MAPLLAPLLAPSVVSQRQGRRRRRHRQVLGKPWRCKRGEVLGDAALFAASGVKSRAAGEGGATPLISRSLDPAP